MAKQMVYPKAFVVYCCYLVIWKLLYLLYCTSIITSFLFEIFFPPLLALLKLACMRSTKYHFACLLLIDWLAPIFFCKLYIAVLHLKQTSP